MDVTDSEWSWSLKKLGKKDSRTISGAWWCSALSAAGGPLDWVRVNATSILVRLSFFSWTAFESISFNFAACMDVITVAIMYPRRKFPPMARHSPHAKSGPVKDSRYIVMGIAYFKSLSHLAPSALSASIGNKCTRSMIHNNTTNVEQEVIRV